MDAIHRSSRTGQWETDPLLVADLKTSFEFDLDVCASRANVCQRYFTEEEDGLSLPWVGLCYMNPPYGKKRKITEWLAKAQREHALSRSYTLALVPARTSTRWWHDQIVPYANLVVFIKGRLRFGSPEYWHMRWTTPIIDGKPNGSYGKFGARMAAPFPSAFVMYGATTQAQKEHLSSYGWAVYPRD